MSYIGENSIFSLRDGYCEIKNTDSEISAAFEIGRRIAPFFRCFCAGCGNFSQNHLLHAVCCGIAEGGRDVYICENTDMPSFRFSLPLLSADCGIYLSDSGKLKFSFFSKNGFKLSNYQLAVLLDDKKHEKLQKFGRIIPVMSFRDIYIANLRASLADNKLKFVAGTSCGNKSVRMLWERFFSDEESSLSFQISDDGSRVNAYSTEMGFLPYEKLAAIYAMKMCAEGKKVYLPQKFHYAADFINNRFNNSIIRFDPENYIPEDAVKQRFLTDTLFMCVQLCSDMDSFIKNASFLPVFASAKREITTENCDILPDNKHIFKLGGRIYISKSGKSRISLLVQSLSAETATELCSEWTEKIRNIVK